MKESSLGTQNKASPSARGATLAILIRAAPILGLGILGVLIGYQLGGLIAGSLRVYLQIAFLALLFALIILDSEPGWNLVFFVGFGLAAGMVLLWSGAETKEIKSWALYLVLLITSLTGGASIRGAGGQEAKLLVIWRR